jgi:AAA15 family ATPase/GTPase
MKNPITTLHIQNFKTIKDLKVKPKRINLIIGKPNVGKSNFLEALSLLGAPYSKNTEKFMGEFIRYNKFEDLFYDKETNKAIILNSNIGSAYIDSKDHFGFRFFLGETVEEIQKEKKTLYFEDFGRIDSDDVESINLSYDAGWGQQNDISPYFQLINKKGTLESMAEIYWYSPVKKYDYQKEIASTNRFHEFLLPPHGENIFTILNGNKKLLSIVGKFFKEYKLKFGLRMSDTSFEVIKQVGHYVYSTSYNLIADTLQRMIFNIAAIASNKESILLFEEPEAHSFPPYIKLFAEKVIESKTNQFFIATHSPFILNTIIENTPLDEVAIFVASYEKFQTKFTELTELQIREMLDYGNDIFFSPQVLA